jgi:nucleoside 2-deoxyribosyltransferase
VPAHRLRIYLASPYGFTDAGREFMKSTMIPAIQNDRFEIMNPWDAFDSISQRIEKINSLNGIREQRQSFKLLNKKLAVSNEKMLNQAEVVVAILDGSDVDSGVASEIGYAYGTGKKIIGYRSDFRLTGDDLGAIVNVQVEYWINASGGSIVTNLSLLQKKLLQCLGR